MNGLPGVFSLKGVLQHYAWGGAEYLYDLTGSSPLSVPAAEYWLGAHPNHPASIQPKNIKLDQYISEDAANILGNAVYSKFGQLPFLLKVLDVKQMLSIQVHPSIASAIEGYQKEDEAGIPVNAANRNYKDRNHKPELMVALSPFWLLHGFKPENEIADTLNSTPELEFLKKSFNGGDYEDLYRTVMEMPQQEVDNVLKPLIERVMPEYKAGKLDQSNPDFWAARAFETFCSTGPLDRGIFSIYLFNLLNLQEGEAIYQPAGLPHAYLEGQNVELMANSDNVLRAGLTPKYIDVPELMKHVKFEATHPAVIRTSGQHQVFTTSAEEFELQLFEGPLNKSLVTETAEIWLQMNGNSSINQLTLDRGEAAFVTAGTDIYVRMEGEGKLFRSLVPTPKS